MENEFGLSRWTEKSFNVDLDQSRLIGSQQLPLNYSLNGGFLAGGVSQATFPGGRTGIGPVHQRENDGRPLRVPARLPLCSAAGRSFQMGPGAEGGVPGCDFAGNPEAGGSPADTRSAPA